VYDEGTWTPTIAGTSTAGTYSYNPQAGFYTRIGNAVFFSFYIVWDSTGSNGTGNISITGFPFTAKSNTFVAFPLGFAEFTFPAGSTFVCRSESGTSTFQFRYLPTGGTDVSDGFIAIDHKGTLAGGGFMLL
jgi:hypothetical protein